MSIAARLLVLLVQAYQWTLRPLLGAQCRFHPSCSAYAVDALRTHGAARGVAMAAWRILRCNPWCRGGYDPVPRAASRMSDPSRATCCAPAQTRAS